MSGSRHLFPGQRDAAAPLSAEQQRLVRVIDEIREHGPERGLTKWEEDFVDSVAEQLEERGTLTDRQIEKLDAIYAERAP